MNVVHNPIPLIAIPANVRPPAPELPLTYHGVAENFLRPLYEYLGFQPLIVPATPTRDFSHLLDMCDGVLLTGAVSNIAPEHYGAENEDPDQRFDPARDALTLPFIRAVVDAGIPLLGICRGMQELNVAFGGSLVQRLHMLPNVIEHRGWVKFQTPEERRAHIAHGMKVEAGGLLERILPAMEFMVNSLHGQGVGRVGKGLRIEAKAPDDTVEAISVEGAAFALGVLWHPEWNYDDNPTSLAIFDNFGKAVLEYAASK